MIMKAGQRFCLHVTLASDDGTIKLRNAQSGQEHLSLNDGSIVRKLSFSWWILPERWSCDFSILHLLLPLQRHLLVQLCLSRNNGFFTVRNNYLASLEYQATSAAVFEGLIVLVHAFGWVSMEFTLRGKGLHHLPFSLTYSRGKQLVLEITGDSLM